MFKNRQAVVVDGHTLGVVLLNGQIQILHASILKGAEIMHGTLFQDGRNVRKATKKDFDIYRVAYNPEYLLD